MKSEINIWRSTIYRSDYPNATIDSFDQLKATVIATFNGTGAKNIYFISSKVLEASSIEQLKEILPLLNAGLRLIYCESVALEKMISITSLIEG